MNPGSITIVGVWAHPDDETYLSAVLMHRVVRDGGRVVVITATGGELGTAEPGLLDRSTRVDELRQALAAVGVDELVLLDIPDGACASQDHAERADQIRCILDDIHPDLVVTFGPDGITGHPDHVAVAAWTLAACEQRNDDLYLAAMTASFADRHRTLHQQIGLSMLDLPLIAFDDTELAARVTPTADEISVKLAAFAAHRSQTQLIRDIIGDAAFESWWIDETFRVPTDDDFAWARDIVSGAVTT